MNISVSNRIRIVIYSILIVIGLLVLLPDNPNNFSFDQSLTPPEEIFHGGPPRDGIPAINHPRFIQASLPTFLKLRIA